MAGLLDDLVDVLHEENQIYENLLKKANQKTDLIIKNEVDKINKVTSEENLLATKCKNQKNKREEIIKDIENVLGAEKEITLKSLIKRLNSSTEDKEKLENIVVGINETVKDLKMTNEKNMKLIEQSLKYVNFTINNIKTSGEKRKSETYHKKGKYNGNSENKASFFDAKQ